CARGSGHFDLW
nr:immunoglobulin heavy chain junction region [Macaca mulatta]